MWRSSLNQTKIDVDRDLLLEDYKAHLLVTEVGPNQIGGRNVDFLCELKIDVDRE